MGRSTAKIDKEIRARFANDPTVSFEAMKGLLFERFRPDVNLGYDLRKQYEKFQREQGENVRVTLNQGRVKGFAQAVTDAQKKALSNTELLRQAAPREIKPYNQRTYRSIFTHRINHVGTDLTAGMERLRGIYYDKIGKERVSPFFNPLSLLKQPKFAIGAALAGTAGAALGAATLFKGKKAVSNLLLQGANRDLAKVLKTTPTLSSSMGQNYSGYGPGFDLGDVWQLMLPKQLEPLAGLGKRRKKYRRMNYGNGKAARRAIRRIKGTRKLLQSIEKQLPRRTVRAKAKRC